MVIGLLVAAECISQKQISPILWLSLSTTWAGIIVVSDALTEYKSW